MEAFRYASPECPASYKCKKCGAFGCKLWRQYQTSADHVELLCIVCAEKDQDKKSEIEEGGSDQIGWLVPAVPTEDGETFWGYSSVPIEGCEWWDNLAIRPGGKPPMSELSPYMRKRFNRLKEYRDRWIRDFMKA